MSVGATVEKIDDGEPAGEVETTSGQERPEEQSDESADVEEEARFPFFDVTSLGRHVHIRAGVASNGEVPEDLVIDARVPLELADQQMSIARQWYTQTYARIYGAARQADGQQEAVDEDGESDREDGGSSE